MCPCILIDKGVLNLSSETGFFHTFLFNGIRIKCLENWNSIYNSACMWNIYISCFIKKIKQLIQPSFFNCRYILQKWILIKNICLWYKSITTGNKSGSIFKENCAVYFYKYEYFWINIYQTLNRIIWTSVHYRKQS